MLFREIITVYFPEDGIKYINTLCDYNLEFLYVRESTYGFLFKAEVIFGYNKILQNH
jgi:hypothetical protein